MTVRRVFIDTVNGERIVIKEDEHHYITRVLRLKTGDSIELITNKGCFSGEILSINKKNTEVGGINPLGIINEPEFRITLFQGLPDHFDKFELIAQKATELGVTEIVPFVSDYTDSKYNKMDMNKKFSRVFKIMQEAVRQCKRTCVPHLSPMLTLLEAVKKAGQLDSVFLLSEKHFEHENNHSGSVMTSSGIFVGPEGGFSDEEFSMLHQSGLKFINLGNRILRTETAAITAISLMHLKYGDFRNSFQG